MMNIRFLLVFISIYLHGCAADLFQGGQPIPPETVSELLMRGASIGSLNPSHKPLPENIGAEILSDQFFDVSSGELVLSILPTDFVTNNLDSGNFYYAFSKDIGSGNFEVLPNRRYSSSSVSPSTNIELIQVAEFLPGMEVISDIEKFYFQESGTLFIPVEAAHLEFRFLKDNEADNFVTIERWDLQDFYGYRTYVYPLIEDFF